MARYTKRVDVWSLPPEARGALQPGQHVEAGPHGARGIYLGQGRGGSDVVAWEGNARGRRASYIRTLRDYAKGIA
jgi:hypothetical protein